MSIRLRDGFSRTPYKVPCLFSQDWDLIKSVFHWSNLTVLLKTSKSFSLQSVVCSSLLIPVVFILLN